MKLMTFAWINNLNCSSAEDFKWDDDNRRQGNFYSPYLGNNELLDVKDIYDGILFHNTHKSTLLNFKNSSKYSQTLTFHQRESEAVLS